MRESPRGDRSVRGDHKEAMDVTTRSMMRSYPTQEAKSRRGTGVGVLCKGNFRGSKVL